MTTFIQILLVAILLAAMIMVLVIIGHLAHPGDTGTKEQRDRLLHDVETRDRVVTRDSLFHDFFARPSESVKHRRVR